jgi:protein gp37
MAKRLAGRYGYPHDPFAVTVHWDKFNPRFGKTPKRIFICSMGDLFHDDVPFYTIHEIWDIIKRFPQHIFMVLTKRPNRMLDCLDLIYRKERFGAALGFWDHVYIGATVESDKQKWRIRILQKIPASRRFVSVEPMLSSVDLSPWLDKINWVICGAETGPGKRPMQIEWAMDLQRQCADAGIPFFFKKDSSGNHELCGRIFEEWPV